MRSKVISEKHSRVERKKKPHTNPGVEIVSKILAEPNNGNLITAMIIGLDKFGQRKPNDPRASQYIKEYWEQLCARQQAYERANVVPLARSK